MADIEKEKLRAVFDEDLRDLLVSLGLIGDFNNGRLTCAFCGDVISWDNLHSIFPDSGQIKVACSKPTCVQELVLRLQDLEMRP